ncbi:tyramine beta-hydroxylase isoform X1 [Patella vulgata]|uniref:tyramine beta-hydroxylase isoform X1 n=1 Tax=Patella vulgata TaxID=6465 RepID=UPI0024A7E9A7|nr:tyramine beta-hydroxylase isoform X1 [Patella vulgata]
MVTYNLKCLLAILCVTCIRGYGNYRDKIPNGNRVPHPCKSNSIWDGVGHQKSAGSGYRNPFGDDFASAERTWTKELCAKDSDGDGKTNGYELGDPNCSWVAGQPSPESATLSHPGVCEPWNDPKCQHQLSWVSEACKSDEFICNALNEIDVKNMTMKFPSTPVPVQETTYICMEFELDNTGDYHMVATQPIVDNVNVMHHAVIFGCSSDTHDIRSTPHECGMVASRECGQILSIWTLGSSGECLHDKVGIRIGTNGIKRVALQFHWNNPTLKTDYTDSSGIIVHYTSNRRENDAGVWTIGPERFVVPPRTLNTELTGYCPSSCTSSMLSDKIYIVSAFNHMHYIGAKQKIELFRDGKRIIDITNDEKYNYDSPLVHEFSTPIEVRPGDVLTTTCGFNSMNRDAVTNWGDATSDEMCYGFMTYYPKENVRQLFCTGFRSIPYCAIEDGNVFEGCEVSKYTRQTPETNNFYVDLNNTCFNSCTTECLRLLDNNPCLKGDPRAYMDVVYGSSDIGREMKRMFSQCDGKLTLKPTTPSTVGGNGNARPTPSTVGGNGNAKQIISSIKMILSFALVASLLRF